jgi:NAD(P)-dependent dehydrogenase (short-subunit alcohol dehydrogenase family)
MSEANTVPLQVGRTIVVTGANSGIGLRSAEMLAARGARVVLACRDRRRGEAALEHVRAQATAADPLLVLLNLGALASVRDAAEEISERVEALDVLMNNAGVMALPPTRSADGFEAHLAVNHLGHFALTLRLLGTLLAAPSPRVVTTASHGHWTGRMRWDDLHWERGHYWPWLVYSQSKLANVLFMRELDRRARSAGIPLVSVGAHPGGAKTNLQSHVEGPVRKRVYQLASRLVQTDGAGAMPQLVAATDASVTGGSYLGPQRLFGFEGPPGPARMSRAARDPQAARRLWEISERLTGQGFEAALARCAQPVSEGAN